MKVSENVTAVAKLSLRYPTFKFLVKAFRLEKQKWSGKTDCVLKKGWLSSRKVITGKDDFYCLEGAQILA